MGDALCDPALDRPEGDIEGRKTLVIGCGNLLLGDDGFGPALIRRLARRRLPGSIGVLDAGTGVRSVLFGLALSERKPRRVIIVDAIDAGRAPGSVFEVDLENIPPVKSDDFSMHQLPTSNLLRELRDSCGVEVRVVAVQVSRLPQEPESGLSAPVAAAMVEALRLVERLARGSRSGRRPE